MTRSLRLYFPALFLGIISLALQIGLYFSGISIQPGDLADPDCYMRLVRVEQLAASGNWFDGKIGRIDPPTSAELHWSRPLDVVILAGALPLWLFTDLHGALFWSGVLCSPLLQVLTILVLLWAVLPIFDERKQMLCCLIFLCQPGLINYFQAGRADHHSLLMLLLVAGMAFSIRLFLEPFGRKQAMFCGLIHALALWVSVEALVTSGIVFMAGSLLWLSQKSDIARKIVFYSWGLSAGCTVAILAENTPALWTRVQLDKLSILHAVLFAWIALLWMMLAWIEKAGKDSFWVKLLSGIGCFVVLVTSLHFTKPEFFQGPYAGFDPVLTRIWLSHVVEAAPLVPDWSQWNRIGIWLYPAIPCGVFLFVVLIRKTYPKEQIPVLVYLLLGGLVFIALSLTESRWAANAEAFLVIPFTDLTARACIYFEGKFQGLAQRLLRVTATFFACGGFMFFILLSPGSGSESAVATPDSDQLAIPLSIAPFSVLTNLMRDLSSPQESKLVLAHLDLGSEILYRTQHSIVSATYFRQGNKHSQDLMRFVYETMTSATDAEARLRISEAHINLILLAPLSPERTFYAQAGANTFYERLLSGEPPSWLKSIPLPQNLQNYRLFEIKELPK